MSNFHNVVPRTRADRRAAVNKESWEKERLQQRKEGFIRVDPSLSGKAMTEYAPSSQGYMSDADRFHTDVAGEEKNRRDEVLTRQRMVEDRRRMDNAQREEQRWRTMDHQHQREIEKVERDRQEGTKSLRNKSSVPFDPVTLGYNNSAAGEHLRQKDIDIKQRANARAKNLHFHVNRNGVNPITGNALGEPGNIYAIE
jgi:hypothetical protein